MFIMPKSQKKITDVKGMTSQQKEILDLEKKYFDKIWEICTSKEFENDLKRIEKYIIKNYDCLSNIWKVKNKIKIPVERLLRYHIYTQLSNDIIGIYPSAISGDVGFITNDAIISLDAKTLDMDGNKGDMKYLQFENNQSSFRNKPLDGDLDAGYIGVSAGECLASMDQYDNRTLPVLTYFLSINYCDDRKGFELNRTEQEGTICLKCLPNGELSNLFENDIVLNFKTYTYYDEQDGYDPIKIGDAIQVKETLNTDGFYSIKNDRIKKNWKKINGRTKKGYYDTEKKVAWFPVKRKKSQKNVYYLEAIKEGNTSRVENETIKDRFDSNGEQWYGYRKYTISNL